MRRRMKRMATKIVMYTGNTCGKCKAAKERLADLPPDIKENVELIERNVDENEHDYKFLTEQLKSNSLPTFLINWKKVRRIINR